MNLPAFGAFPRLLKAPAGAVLIMTALAVLAPAVEESGLFKIKVVEARSGWPVPMIELRTTHGVRFVSDNRGLIAFDLPELMGRPCWFSVEGHGYGVAPDGFGYRGVRLTPEEGKEVTIEVRRDLPGKRLGRLTGAGLFAESQRFGHEDSWRESGILGCDSVQVARHRGKLFWMWGDTTMAAYPLGLFHMTAATTPVNPLSSLEPPLQLPFEYFRDDHGAVRTVAKMPGPGPTWLSGLVSLPDRDGNPRLVACYRKIKPPLETYESGLCLWDEDEQKFVHHRTLWTKSDDVPKSPRLPEGHAVFHSDEAGREWTLFGDPFPKLKMPTSFEAWKDPESWIPLKPQKSVPARDGSGTIEPHRGSIAWNHDRQKWVAILTQKGGDSSFLGEIWYAESDRPEGPWGSAVKVVTHQNYTFYNPRLHPELTAKSSSVLLFEGTFTRQFADRPDSLPRYDYNQILYRLDLDDPDLVGE